MPEESGMDVGQLQALMSSLQANERCYTNTSSFFNNENLFIIIKHLNMSSKTYEYQLLNHLKVHGTHPLFNRTNAAVLWQSKLKRDRYFPFFKCEAGSNKWDVQKCR
ncbi:hypothetical protein COOONC_04596 [Cooperia oncophora]